LIRAAAALVVLLLAGCGGTAASLDDAAEATSAETARLEMDWGMTGGPPEANFAMKARGVFDFPNERAAMTVSGEMKVFGEDVAFEDFRLIGKTGYTRWLIKGKAYWVQTDESDSSDDPTDLLLPLPGTSTKPTDVLARVLAASDETEEIGHEEIRGTDTTHYRARVDVKKLAKQLPPEDRPDEGDIWGPRFVPVELWIDDENRLRRITTVEKDDDDPVTMTMTVELYDYGVEVDVEPPEGEVLTEEEFEKLEGSPFHFETESEAGEGEPLSPDEVCADAREHLPKKEAAELCASLKEKQ
jgi:LppX_LprAFG lipoprotein